MVASLFGKARVALALGQPAQAPPLIRAALDSARQQVAIRNGVAARRAFAQTQGIAADLFEQLGQRATADSLHRNRIRLDSLLLINEAKALDAQNTDRALESFSRVLNARARSDGAGKSLAEQIALNQRRDLALRRGAETRVWERRQALSLALTPLKSRRDSLLRAPSLRDSLSQALNSLSWTLLLLDHPEQAVEAAREALPLAKDPSRSFALPNYFNALVLSGRDEEAAALFRVHANEKVEDPQVPFPCAVVRDMRAIHLRGVASDRHLAVVERIATAYLPQCQLGEPTLP